MDTWINGNLISIDMESLWRDEFARWDTKVDTALAARIATAIENTINEALKTEDCTGWQCCEECAEGNCCAKNHLPNT